MKRIIIIILICIIAAGIVFSFFHFFKPKQIHISESLRAVPTNSSLLIEINDFNEFFKKLSENNIYNELSGIKELNTERSLMHYINRLSEEQNEFKKLSSNSSVLVSFHILGRDKIKQLVILSIPIEDNEKTIIQNLIKYYEDIAEIKFRQYDNSTIYEVSLKELSESFYFTAFKGLFICSRSPLLVESSVRQLESDSYITNIPEFNTVYQTAGKNELANIYINKNNFSEIVKVFLDNKFHSGIAGFEHFGTWTELDLSIGKDIIYLNGFSAVSDTVITFLDVLETQSPTSMNVTRILPDGTGMYLFVAINNIVRYDQFLSRYLNLTNRGKTRDEKISEINRQTNVDIKKVFYPLINNEICLAVTNVNILDIFQNSFIIMGIKSRSHAENEVNNMLKLASKKLNTSYYDYIDEINIDESSSIKIYSLPFNNTGELLFGPYFSICSAKYLTLYDNFLIFANSKEALYRLVHDAILNRTLSTSIGHNKFLNQFSNRANMFFYFSTHVSLGILQNYLKDNHSRFIVANTDNFNNIGSIGYQVTKSQNMMYNNLVIKHLEDVSERPQTAWESRLDTNINMKPAIVINHNNNTREIIVQDLNNNLYLLSNSGREIWKIQLDEPITSNIYQVDYYNNNRLQYLFSTKSKIHLIDRLGNYVERYPITLRAESTAPLTLFDYNNDKNYRFFIPCKDNKVYLYDIEGNIIKGWKFDKTENIVTNEVSFYRFRNKDFIVFNDKYKAYIMSRRGEEKIKVKTNFNFSRNNKIWFDNFGTNFRFITTNTNGTIKIINNKGDVDSIKIKEFSENHYFALSDMNRNGTNDFVFLDNNKLEVYTKNKKLLFEFVFPDNPQSEPSFYYFPGNQIKLGVVCKSSGKIYLINHDGSLFNGFPLQGLTQFSIGYLSSSTNKFNLIVGGPENLLYNYEVNEN